MSSSKPEGDANANANANANGAHNTTLPLIITVVLLTLLFLGFLTIYFCHFIMEYLGNASGLRSANTNTDGIRGGINSPQGLDPTILLSFPTLKYSEVKDLRQEKYGLECAVCLSEFQDNDELRLLPVCNHAFHPDCIDLWLKSHTTCPFCRCELDNPWEKLQEVSIMIPVDVDTDSAEDTPRLDHMHRVSFKDEQDERWRNEGGLTVENLGGHETAQRFSRSHSTGHSIIREDDRYTLRLPDNVKERIIRRHRYTGSCTKFGDYSGNVTIEKSGLGELSGTSHAIEIKA